MQTVVTATDTYKFNELSEKTQEKVLNDMYDINIDSDWYAYDFIYWKKKLEKIGFLDTEIYFSGFYSQGAGACFDADIEVNEYVFDCFVESLQGQKEYEKLFNQIIKEADLFFDYLYRFCNFSIEKINYRYSHENTRKIRGDIESDILVLRYYEQCFDLFLAYLEDLRLDLSQTIYFDLRQEYEYLTSREAIIETIDINEYTFTKEGKIF